MDSMQREQSTKTSEFDRFAEDYTTGVDRPLKRLLGKSASSFIQVKALYLMDHLKRQAKLKGRTDGGPHLLDFGCGTGEFLWFLDQYGFSGQLEGCDMSAGMLAEAAGRWSETEAPVLHVTGEGRLPFASASFDLITASCVYHHVPVDKRAPVTSEIFRLLKDGGQFVVFEHNPYNPLTRWMVARSPFDVNAELLTARVMADLMTEANFQPLKKDYILFFPPRLGWLRGLERYLRWLPLGGQYAVVGIKKADSAAPVTGE